MERLSLIDAGEIKDSDFCTQYARARERQAENFAEDLIEISDDGRNDTYLDNEGKTRIDYDNVQRSKLRVDTRKWIASKLLPKKYGERNQPNISVTTNILALDQSQLSSLQDRRKKAESLLLTNGEEKQTEPA